MRRGPEVEIVFYKDMKDQFDEVEKIVHKLIGEGLSSDDITILIPVSLEKSLLHNKKSVAGLSVVSYDPTTEIPKSIRYSTVQAFKGLESKAVIVTDIVDLDECYSRYVNYVGLSRAMSWLAVMINEKARAQYSDKARDFGKRLSSKLGTC